ncbi:MAG TPA: T9SS type A sorting domain-containing protein, partial [Candidatus Eisenbacteria bacterium]|nr:T9SS type A sorting domain-containing protein [Candidatus Eisenbacteria bacterium]
LATADFSASSASVLLGNGDGTFQPKVDYGTWTNPTAIAIGDVSADGKPDLVTTGSSLGFNMVSVLLNNGDGTFQTKVDYEVGTLPWAVAIGDVSGDSKSDIVTANYFGGTLSVLLGNGDGTFQASVDYGTADSPISVAIRDVSGDGKPDLIAAANGGVSVHLGNGDGTFQPKTDYPGVSAYSVAIGDVSLDGELDIVTANGTNTVSAFLGNGDGTFRPRLEYGTGSEPRALAVGDVSGDGKPDVVTANHSENTVSILKNIAQPPTTAIHAITLTAEATASRVRIEWYAPGDDILEASVYRRTDDSDWALQGHPEPDMQRRILYEDDTVVSGVRYGYRLVLLDVTGQESAVETWVSVPENAPAVIRLEAPRPNPFVNRVELTYGLPHDGRVRLALYDVRGRRVALIVDRVEAAGWRSIGWNGRNGSGRELPSGAYFLKLEYGDQTQVRKVLIAR